MKIWMYIAILLWQPALTYALTPDAWKQADFSYQEDNNNMRKFLNVFSQAFSIRTHVNFSGLLDKKLSVGPHTEGKPMQILDRLASIYGFQWFVYRNTLYISNHNSVQAKNFALKGITPSQAKQALIGVGLLEEKFGWAEFDRGKNSIVLISGPQSYLDFVGEILNRIDRSDPAKEERIVMVFPLRYASAIDIETVTRGGNVKHLGVVSMLRNLLSTNMGYSENGTGVLSEGRGLQMTRNLLSSSTIEETPSRPSIARALDEGNPLASIKQADKEEEPLIEAYAALNAVVIRDKASRKPMYENLFKTLDVRARRVELIATIVDVDVKTLDEWIPQITIGGNKNSISLQTDTGLGAIAGSNAVLVSTNRFFMALKNSEATGNARIQSRPSIMTLDNLSAILDLSQTAYFKLIGERMVDLKQVTVGTRMKVIPRILGDTKDSDLHVQIELEDGTLQTPIDTSEPNQSRSSHIATQAIISPGQSLLIGGYRRDASEQNRSHMPYFSSLPAIGSLFRSETKMTHRVERLFVLSARVVIDPVPQIADQVKQFEKQVMIE